MRLLLLLLFSVCFHVVYAEEFNAKVIAVMDGDTILVLREGKQIKVRLANIDAPEKAQEYGAESRQALLDMVLKKQVHVNSLAMDSYGRMVAEISVDGRSVNAEQVRRGMAWEYSHFHRNKHYLVLQSEARQARRGLWAQAENPLPPEQWRKAHPAAAPAPQQHAKPALPAAARDAACGSKHYCEQMSSCDEANFYLHQCGVKTLDGNGDGVPCDDLCESKRRPLR
jgi:micrococcal nuclease